MNDHCQEYLPLADRLTTAQLEKTRLEIEKLRAEAGLSRWGVRVAALTPLISVAIGVAGFLFGIYQFRQQLTTQQERLLVEQRKDDLAQALERKFRLQNQIRADAEALMQFFYDRQTGSSAGLRFDTLRAYLDIARSESVNGDKVALTNTREITTNLVRSIADDSDLSYARDAAFVNLLLQRWPDYPAYHRAEQGTLRGICQKYADAAKEFTKKNPQIIATVAYDSSDHSYVWPAGYGLLSPAEARHFGVLISGFRSHVALVEGKEHRWGLAARIAAGTGNATLFRDIIVAAQMRSAN